VVVTTDDATTRRFDLQPDTRLDGASTGRFTGSCILRQMRDGSGNAYWGATVELRSGGTAPGDATPLSRVTIVQNSVAAAGTGYVELELGATTLSPVDGACSLELPYALGDGVVGVAGSCTVSDVQGNQTAQVAVDLDFAGCTVER
jgi:hypothetical protein